MEPPRPSYIKQFIDKNIILITSKTLIKHFIDKHSLQSSEIDMIKYLTATPL